MLKTIGLISKGETMRNIKAGKLHKESLHEWLKKKPKHQQEYLKASVEENYDMPEAILAAIRDVAEVRGYEKLAKEAGLSQNGLYKILDEDKKAKPRFETIIQLLRALGLRFTVEPIHKSKVS